MSEKPKKSKKRVKSKGAINSTLNTSTMQMTSIGIQSDVEPDLDGGLNQKDFASKLSNTLMELSNISNNMKVDINNLTSITDNNLSEGIGLGIATGQPLIDDNDEFNSLSLNCAQLSTKGHSSLIPLVN